MRKLTLLIISLFVTLGVMAQTATLEISTSVDSPENLYQIKSANNIWMAASTTPTQNNKGHFAFFAADGENAYKIYSIDQQKWVSYDKSNTSNDCRNFATLVASQDDANAWKITSATRSGQAVYQIQPFNSDGTVSNRYWNWNGGVGSGGNYGYNYDDGKTIGLWRDNASDDGGSAWILVNYVSSINDFVNGDVYTFITERGWMGSNGNDYVISTAYTQNNIAAADITDTNPNFQWTVYKSVNDCYYLYNIGRGMFMGVESSNNTKVPFVATPAGADLTFKNSSNAAYPIMFSTDNAAVVNHSPNHEYGLISWTGGWNNLNDGGSNHKVKLVGTLDDATLENIENLVNEYETELVKTELATAIAKAEAISALRGTGVGKYSYTGLNSFDEVFNEIKAFDADNATIKVLKEKIEVVEGLINLCSLNMPEAGNYYRIKAVAGWNDDAPYLGSNNSTVNNSRAEFVADANDYTIFHFDGNYLKSLASDNYLVNQSNFLGYNGVQETGSKIAFRAASNGLLGAYNISFNEGARWLYVNQTNYTDAAGSCDDSNGYCFNIEEVTALPAELAAGYYTIACGEKYVSDDKKSAGETQRVLTTGEVTSKNIFYYDGQALIGFASGCGFEYAICNTGEEGPLNFFTFYRSTTSGEYLIKSSDGNSTVGWANGFWKANDGNYLERVDKENASLWTLTPVTMAAQIGEQVYYTLTEAAAAAQAGQTIVLLKETDETYVLPAGVKLDKNGFTASNVKETDPVAKIGDVDYYTFEDALDAAAGGETITLVADVTCTEKPVFNNGGVVNVDINGHLFVSSEKVRVRCVGNSTDASNNIKFVRGFGWDAYYKDNTDEKFRVFPTLDEAVAYKSGTNAANIYPYEDVVQDKDITFCTTGEHTSTALTNDAGYKTSWDLNGFTVLQETAAGNPLESTVLGEFTLLDSSAEKTGKWIAGAYDGNTGGGPAFIVNRADAHLILQGGTISIARNGDVVNTGGLINTIYGTLTVDGATLQMDDQYGIMAWGGNVVVKSGEFLLGENNSSSVFAMKYYSDASVTINANLGGTLYAHSSATATVNVPGVKYYVYGTDYVAPNVGEGLIAQGGVVGYPVAKIGETGYLTLQAAVAAAQDGDEVVVVADVADVVVDIDKNLTISGSATLNNVGLNANGADALTVKGLDFTGNSWINSGTAEALTISGITANVAPVNTSYTNSRSAFISLGKVEAQQLALTVEDSKITVTSQGPDAILGWAAITEATIKNNVLKGSSDGYFNNADAVKFMAIADGAKFDISGNEIYSNYNGIVFAQNTTRDNAYSVEAAGNKFVGGADHIWIEVSGGDVTHATFNAASDNTVNGNAITANDIKYHSGVIKSWSSYAGIDVVTDADGKVIGGTLASFSNEESLADGFVFNENGDGTYGVQFASYIVLPDGVNSSNYAELFGDNTVTDGTNYYATLQAAVEAVAGQANAVLYCKPGADVGSLQHAPVTSTLTVYGNGADVTGDTERDFDLGNTDPSGGNDITADMTLSVKHLNGCGAWGAKATEHTVNLVFENCANMGKVFITGTTGTLNITMTDCAFEGVIKEAVYSNADGAITLINVAFSNLNKAVNLNHKAAGTQTVTIDGCTFTDCGADVAADQIPVRVLSSVEGGKSVLTVTGSTFTGTPDGGADILLDYGVGLTTASVSGTAANVVVEKEHNVGTTTAVKAEETVEFTTALPVAKIGETMYMTLADAVSDAQAGDEIVLLADVETADGIVITDKNLVINLNSKTYTTTEGASTNNRNFKIEGTSVVTIKNGTMVAAGDYSSGAYGTVRTEGSANVTLEGLKLYNYRGNGLNIKAYAGTTVTVKDTEIYANYGGGIESAGGTIVVDNVTVEQKGMYISPYNSMAISVNGGGKVTVNSGTYSTECITAEEANNQGSSHGPWVAGVLNSGGTLIINGGTFSNDNFGENSLATYARGAILADTKAKVEINGGTFNVLKNVIDIQNNLGDANNNPSVVLAGGTYNADPRTSAQYGSNLITLADGYAVVANGDGTYSVADAAIEVTDAEGNVTYIANTRGFNTSNVTLKLMKDVAGYNLNLNKATGVVFDLNGYTFAKQINLNNGAELTIKDTSAEKTGKVIVNQETNNTYAAVVIMRGTLTVEGGTIETTGTTGAIQATHATLNIKGGKFVSQGNGIELGTWTLAGRNLPSAVTMTGGEIVAEGYGIKDSDNHEGTTIAITGGEIKSKEDCIYINRGTAAVSGGTFSKEIAEKYCAEGYVCKANGDGTYSVEEAPAYVAKIGEQGYETLAAALAAAQTGDVVTMLSDVELTEAVKVVGKAITLDLNGKTVSGVCNSNQGHLVYIENGAGLTVKDGAVDGGGKLTYAQGTSNIGWTVAVMGNLTLESGTIELTGEWSIGYAVDVRPNAWGVAYTAPSVFTMNGGNVVSSDGAVRVASSSADQYANVSASFVMNGGEIDAAWDGVFIQQSNEAYDVLNFTINEGTIKSGLNPVRVYGPAPTSYVNGQECMSINFNGGTMTYTGTETREWVIDGVLRVGGGSSIETIVENGNITAGEAFAQAQALPDGYKWEQDGETYKVVEAPATGKISYRAYINDSESREAVQVDLENVYARNSLVVKLFDAEGNALTTTTLKQGGVEAAAYTCNIVLWGTASGSWDTDIHAEKLTVANYPQKGELWIDGNLVDTFDGILGKVTDAAAYQLPAYLALDCVYKEAKVGETYYATLADAVAAAEGETVTMLADVELAEDVTIPAGKVVTLDLNGKTVSQSKECTASYAMITNNGSLTITGNGKLSFTDTSAGDPSFGWGSYTINNLGTLVVENGTIEHLGAQTFAKHMICAIFQYSGSTTINGGTISTPSYRSARLWKGDMTINGGEFDGQLWVQAVDDSAKLTINGGTFAPNGGDASSVFVGNVDSKGNLRNVEFAVTDGTFTTKIGCSNADEIAGDGIKGGKFTESAMNNTNSALLAEGFVFAGEAVDGYYGIVADPSYIAELVIDDAEGENYTNDTEKRVGTLTYKRTLFNGKWNALYLPFEVELTDELLANYDFADYNQMISHDTNGDRVPDSFEMELFIYTGGTLEANYPYFVRPKNEEACSLNLVLTDATLYPANEISLVTSSVKNTFKLSGTYSAMDAAALAGKYAISIDGDWSYSEALKPYRLYLTITDNNGAFVASGASKSVRIVVRGEDGFTGIEDVTDENVDEMIYDLQGRRILEPQKGEMYIINGKKVIY